MRNGLMHRSADNRLVGQTGKWNRQKEEWMDERAGEAGGVDELRAGEAGGVDELRAEG